MTFGRRRKTHREGRAESSSHPKVIHRSIVAMDVPYVVE